LNINEKDEYGNYPLLWACIKNNTEMVQLLMNYANQKDITLTINDKENDYGQFPLFWACYKNNTEMVQLLMNYANNQKEMTLILNDKVEVSNFNLYPLYCAAAINNTEMVELLINYANQNNISLDMDDNGKGKNPLSWAVAQNNFDMVKLILDYANEKEIKLELKETILENTITEHYKNRESVINSISELEFGIIELLSVNRKNNKLDVVFNMESESPLMKIMEETEIKKNKKEN